MFGSRKITAVILLAVLMVFTAITASVIDGRKLSVKSKTRDFDYLCEIIESGQPMLDEYRNVLGYDFCADKDYYRSLIADTENDYEYYVILRMIMEEFPSIHTDITTESYEDILRAGYRVLKSRGNAPYKSDYWQQYENRFLSEQYGSTFFLYYDGHYISNMCSIAENPSQTLELLEIDGENIHTYVTNKEVNGRLAWDGKNRRVYRFSLSLNLSFGRVVTATFRNRNGDIFEREVCIRNKDCAFAENDLQPISTPEVDEYILDETAGVTELLSGDGHYFYAVSVPQQNLSYINIYNFSNDYGAEISEALKKTGRNDNIILDLRYNSGGYVEFFIDNVYPYLFSHDMEAELSFSAYSSFTEEKAFSDGTDDISWKSGENGMVVCKQQFYGKGCCFGKKNVYILISNTTSSAADTAAAMLKDNTAAVLIGCHTAGEGLGDTACADALPSSGIPFKLQYTQAFNSDGSDNSVCGTSPNIYLAHDFEAVAKRNQIMSSGQNAFTYENRLKWDNVLIETLEMIKESEAAEQ